MAAVLVLLAALAIAIWHWQSLWSVRLFESFCVDYAGFSDQKAREELVQVLELYKPFLFLLDEEERVSSFLEADKDLFPTITLLKVFLFAQSCALLVCLYDSWIHVQCIAKQAMSEGY